MGLNLAEALIASDSDPNFLPCASITLYVNVTPSLGTCGICHVNELRLGKKDDRTCPASESSLAILACGHIACIECLSKCLQNKPQCPFCRFELKYELCSHPMEARVITRDNLLSIPATVPMGGVIPYQCRDCRIATNKATNETVLKSLAEGFQTLRQQYQAADDRKKEAIRHKLEIMQKQFQMVAGQLSAETTALLTSQW